MITFPVNTELSTRSDLSSFIMAQPIFKGPHFSLYAGFSMPCLWLWMNSNQSTSEALFTRVKQLLWKPCLWGLEGCLSSSTLKGRFATRTCSTPYKVFVKPTVGAILTDLTCSATTLCRFLQPICNRYDSQCLSFYTQKKIVTWEIAYRLMWPKAWTWRSSTWTATKPS